MSILENGLAPQAIPILSLVVAMLAVIVGPLVQWRIAKRQIVDPMRQAWINELRKMLSKLLGTTSYFMARGVDIAQDSNDLRELAEIQQEIVLTLNPREDDHRLLMEKIRMMAQAVFMAPDRDQFVQLHGEVTELAQTILKREWNRVK
jgi:hypothetical protein